jgi:hypothetical protein
MRFSFVMWSAAPFAGSGFQHGLDAEGALGGSEYAVVPRVFRVDRLDEGARR